MLLHIALAALRRAGPTITCVAIVTAVLGFAAATKLRMDNSIPEWLPAGSSDLVEYAEFREVFGDDTFVVIAWDDVDLGDSALPGRLATLHERLLAIEGVTGAVVPAPPFGATAPTAHLVARDSLVAERGTLGVSVTTVGGLPSPAARERFAAIETIARAAALGDTLNIAGPEAINHALDVGSEDAFSRLFPVVVLVIAAVLFLALRALQPVLAILAVAAIASTWTLGIAALAGRPMNMVLSTLPSLLVVLGTAYSLHVTNAFRAARGADVHARWAAALRDTLRPCFVTAVTTAAGFFALATADLRPVRDLGLLAGLGTLCSFGLVFTFLPAVLRLTWRHAGTDEAAPDHAAVAAARPGLWSPGALIRRARWGIVAAAGIAAVVAGLGIAQLHVGSHILAFFPDDAPIVRATEHVERRLFGLTALDVWVRGPVDQVLGADGVSGLRQFAVTALEAPDVTGLVGPLVSDPHLAGISAGDAATAFRLALAESGGGDRARLDRDRVQLRFTVPARTTSIEDSAALVDSLTDAARRSLPLGTEVAVTGAIPLLVRVQQLLLRTQIITFCTSLLVVTGVLAAAFRSWRLAALSLVPNVLPIAMTLGVMGWIGTPLDVATVTVAGVAMGLVVDDTIHLLERFSRTSGAPRTRVERVDHMLRTTGRPVIATTLATTCGFAAFAFSDFQPILWFGVLIAVTALHALLCDLLVLPALLLVRT